MKSVGLGQPRCSIVAKSRAGHGPEARSEPKKIKQKKSEWVGQFESLGHRVRNSASNGSNRSGSDC